MIEYILDCQYLKVSQRVDKTSAIFRQICFIKKKNNHVPISVIGALFFSKLLWSGWKLLTFIISIFRGTCRYSTALLKYRKKYNGIYSKSFYSRQSWIFPLSNAEKKVQKLFEIMEICSNLCSLRDAPLSRPFSVSAPISLHQKSLLRNLNPALAQKFVFTPEGTAFLAFL